MLTFSDFKLVIAVTLALAISSEIVILYIKVQDIANLTATARNAAEQKKADTDKLIAEAKEAHEIAKNAYEMQQAEAKIAEQKAETEYQAAVNAERRAKADAEKMEALAISAKQKALNAVLRSKAEATKIVAAVNALRAELQMRKNYPYGCHKQRTFKECVDVLERATNNGRWLNPDDVSSNSFDDGAQKKAAPKGSAGGDVSGTPYNHTPTVGDKTDTAVVTSLELNVRNDGTPEADIVGKLKQNQSVRVFRRLDSGWVEIQGACDTGNCRGFVNAKYLALGQTDKPQ